MNDSASQRVQLPRPEAQQSAPPPPQHRFRWRLAPIAGIVLLSASVGAGAGAGVAALIDDGGNTPTVQQQAATASSPSTTQTASKTQTGSSVTAAPASLADLYDRVRPSVVKITAVSRSGSGTGSGLVLDTDGHIVTNNHVIDGANELDVRLSDGSDVTATLVGTDAGDDLAVLKIDPTGLTLTPVQLGNSDDVRIGDSVVAIGNPLDLEATLTQGVISGVGRVLSGGQDARPQRELIQTDTAINPGNSGGGLFNLNGELIGITNAIENPSGQDSFAGIGYAIPVSTLQTYLPQLLAGTPVDHARLGVALQDLTPAVAQSMGINVDQGVIVEQVETGSGAAKAGLRAETPTRAGDVITAIDGHQVKTFNDLAGYVDTKHGGDSVALTVVRDSQQSTINVTLDTWTS